MTPVKLDHVLYIDGEPHPVTLTRNGHFSIVIRDDDEGKQEVARATLADLSVYADGRSKRLEEVKRKNVPPVRVSLIPYAGQPPITVEILGLTPETRRPRVRGLPKGTRISDVETLYRPFTPDDHAKYREILQARDAAIDELREFLKARILARHLRDFARSQDAAATTAPKVPS